MPLMRSEYSLQGQRIANGNHASSTQWPDHRRETRLPDLYAGRAARFVSWQIGDTPLTVYVQDDPAYAAGVANVIFDDTLENSYRLNTEFVPTLIRVQDGQEVERTYGWHREDWQRIAGHPDLGQRVCRLMRPGCGSKTLDPGVAEELAIRFGGAKFSSRQVELGDGEDPMEACFDRGWTDGLPVVPPTQARVLRMLAGTTRAPDEMLGMMPPDLAPCTVEKVAINAVMAGCKPEYMPVVLAAVEAALIDEFGMHGVLCTTMFCGPLVIVNGPVAKAIGMNSGVNALGQGNRANASIGRALQLVIRNVGGGRPGELDRAALGTPGKYSFCFAEAEDSDWEPLSVERGFAPARQPSRCSPPRACKASSTKNPARPNRWREALRCACARWITPSWRWRATRCWWCHPNTAVFSSRRAGQRPACSKNLNACSCCPATR